MFLNPINFGGEVLIDKPDFKLLEITESDLVSLTSSKEFIGRSKNIPRKNINFVQFEPPRCIRFAILFKQSDTESMSETIRSNLTITPEIKAYFDEYRWGNRYPQSKKIQDAITLMTKHQWDLTIEGHRKLFLLGIFDDKSNKVNIDNDINEGELNITYKQIASVDLDDNGVPKYVTTNFKIAPLTIPNSAKESDFQSAIVFINEFERIIVPIKDGDFIKHDIINNLNNRITLPGRVSNYYIVYYVNGWKGINRDIYYKSATLPRMTTEEMLSYFGNEKQNGSKLETFANSCRHMSNHYSKDKGNGQKFLIMLTRRSLDIMGMPLDWTLTRFNYFNVLSSDSDQDENVKLIVEIGSQCDDFITTIYSLSEQEKCDICITVIPIEKVDEAIELVEKDLNKLT